MKEITTVQMVQWLSSVSANQCKMRALVRILPGANFFSIFFFTASDAGKAVYIHQQHSMGDAPYVGSRLGDVTYTSPKSLSDTDSAVSDVRYALVL